MKETTTFVHANRNHKLILCVSILEAIEMQCVCGKTSNKWLTYCFISSKIWALVATRCNAS